MASRGQKVEGLHARKLKREIKLQRIEIIAQSVARPRGGEGVRWTKEEKNLADSLEHVSGTQGYY